eukprot:CAMPEP_0197034764 /NCGR_PEP_ID=MMETSP1384-20130603/12754_1 /TAXON_ID=29189 /ORGANISM="Ammonia sp." /LENGTH=320 /DNA_ID=CAMNT_0042464719 /DNA_START=18 /DNA_END=980 /DNA_ORIENTATION=-
MAAQVHAPQNASQTSPSLENRLKALSTELAQTQSLLESKRTECEQHVLKAQTLKEENKALMSELQLNRYRTTHSEPQPSDPPDSSHSTISKLQQQIVTLKSALNDKNQEAFALETDLSNLESQISAFTQNKAASNNGSNSNSDDKELRFDLQRKASQRFYAMRASSVENIDTMSNMDLLREKTPSQHLDESPSPPPKMYHAVLQNVRHRGGSNEESLSDTGILKKEERAELEQRIRKEVEEAYQDRFDSMVKDAPKANSALLSFLNLAGLLFIVLLVMLAVMGKNKLLCDECDDCQQMLADRYVDCQDPPLSAVQIDCPI